MRSMTAKERPTSRLCVPVPEVGLQVAEYSALRPEPTEMRWHIEAPTVELLEYAAGRVHIYSQFHLS